MDKGQFNVMMGAIGEVKSDIKDLRAEQIDHGKLLSSVGVKVKTHSWIHRTTGLAGVALFVTWLKSKLG